ncbi:MAG TPA: hypothetical protein VME66_00095, partial [Candidatus Acidoferrales bacterium]|nr:hypothetical protein [Candidatus Acidoferrales bacterium]
GAGGGYDPYVPVAIVPVGQKWSYILTLTGPASAATISLQIISGAGALGNTTNSWPMPSWCANEGMYFKAGDYDQADTSTNPPVTAIVEYYGLTFAHSENLAPTTPGPSAEP